MEKERIILIILVLGIIALFFYLKPQSSSPVVTTTSPTTSPIFSEEIKKQNLQKLNLTYTFSNGSTFSIAKYLDFSQFTFGNETYIKNSSSVVFCLNKTCNVLSEATTPFDEFLTNFQDSTFKGVGSTRFGICKIFSFVNSTKRGSVCILENGFPYNYSYNGLNFTLKKIQNFSNPIGYILIHFYSYYNESANKTVGKIEIFSFHDLKNEGYEILASQVLNGKINASKGLTSIDFSTPGYTKEIKIIIENTSFSAKPEFYYSGCPSYCAFGCILGTSNCYFPSKLQLKNGNFSQGFYGWNTDGTGFKLCNSTYCQAPFGGAWSGYSAVNFATTCNGKTTSFGNLTSNFFVAYLPFLNFQVVSYPSAGMYFLIVAKNGSTLDKYEIDTTAISKNVTTFANVSIPIAKYIFKEIAIKIVQTQSGFIDYVKCLAVGNFYQTSNYVITPNVVIRQIK